MRGHARIAMICAAAAVLAAGCASRGPVVSIPPTVTVSSFTSISFSPTLAKFEAKILVHNNAPVDLEFQRVDYAVDLFDAVLFTDSFSGLKRTRGNGNQTVTFPFQIAMRDIAAQGIDLFSEQSLRVTFHGQVRTAARYGMDPAPFAATITVPLPRVPEVSYVGSEGEPLSPSWHLTLSVRNLNSFPVTLTSVKTFVALNDTRYSLLRTQGPADLQPGQSLPVVLAMESSPGKVLGMALNLAENRTLRVNLGGTMTCSTPYGWLFIPLDLNEVLQ